MISARLGDKSHPGYGVLRYRYRIIDSSDYSVSSMSIVVHRETSLRVAMNDGSGLCTRLFVSLRVITCTDITGCCSSAVAVGFHRGLTRLKPMSYLFHAMMILLSYSIAPRCGLRKSSNGVC